MTTSKYLSALMLAALIACSNTGANENNSTIDSVDTTANNDGSESALSEYAKTLPLDKIKLPEGFKIEVFAEVPDARSMAISPSGVVYVGNKDGNKVYAVKDSDG